MTDTLLHGLVDDAGLFPPTALPMRDALARNAKDRAARDPMLTQRFLVPTELLDELLGLLPEGSGIELGLIHAGSGAELLDALARAEGRVRHVELKGAAALSDVPDDLPVYVEPLRFDALPGVIEAVRSAGRIGPTGVKVRCGGIRADLFPTVDQLAEALRAVVSASLPMKATAGLHSAIRNTNPETGFEHHGFLNLLTAIDAALSGGDVAAVLAERDPARVAEAIRAMDEDRRRAVRHVLVSYGSCSTSSPVQQAARLGLRP
ncbi:hypothetical protein [Cumulibacter manganitolerans]|uniref:hypothetical protein n=1 Tax=Cumulibacter manganitolerans TaxID=1884992 RepID=UPI001295CBA8|nr:hypothetical protein [Cumulibacter manganitolerans]